MDKNKLFRYGPSVVKFVLLGLTFLFLYIEIFQKHELPELYKKYQNSLETQPFSYLILLGLMLLNWSIETRKWRFLLPGHVPISFFKAFRAVMTGVAVSLFTPNRVGEFGGRMLFVKPENRVTSVSASLAGSLAQFTSTILFGLIACAIYLNQAQNPDFKAGAWVFLLSGLLTGLTLFLYFKVGKISKWIEQRKWHVSISKAFRILSEYNSKELGINLLYSMMRYLVFAIQLILVINLMVDFPEQPGVGFMAMIVATYFFLQTAIPTIALSEIGVRGMVLSFLFFEISDRSQLILAGSLLWLINIIIPAILGAIFIFGVRLAKPKGE